MQGGDTSFPEAELSRIHAPAPRAFGQKEGDMKRLMMGAFLVLFVSQAAQAISAPVRFTFRKGEKLTYSVRMRSSGAPEGKPAFQSDLSGIVVLETLNVRPDGSAQIKVTCSGKGTIISGDESVDLDEGLPDPLVILVKSDGAIAEFRDLDSQRTYLLNSMFDLLNAGNTVRSLLFGEYTMFGLQLPPKMPSAGGAWKGVRKREMGRGSADLTKTWVEMVPEAISFKRTRTGKYHNVTCLEITSLSARRFDMPDQRRYASGTWYFDGATGRVVGFESHLRKWGPNKADDDCTISLAKVEPAGH
jgi:hypothetical protein